METDRMMTSGTREWLKEMADMETEEDCLPRGDEVSYLPETSARNRQVAGSHYKHYAIQPLEYIVKNKMGFCEASVVKYITRWRDKGGKEDLLKAKHFIDLLIEIEGL